MGQSGMGLDFAICHCAEAWAAITWNTHDMKRLYSPHRDCNDIRPCHSEHVVLAVYPEICKYNVGCIHGPPPKLVPPLRLPQRKQLALFFRISSSPHHHFVRSALRLPGKLVESLEHSFVRSRATPCPHTVVHSLSRPSCAHCRRRGTEQGSSKRTQRPRDRRPVLRRPSVSTIILPIIQTQPNICTLPHPTSLGQR